MKSLIPGRTCSRIVCWSQQNVTCSLWSCSSPTSRSLWQLWNRIRRAVVRIDDTHCNRGHLADDLGAINGKSPIEADGEYNLPGGIAYFKVYEVCLLHWGLQLVFRQ